jgi:hypothetical protein
MTKKDNKFFWHTLPGILTGIAGVIGAIAALYVAIHSYGSAQPAPSPIPTPLLITITSPNEGDKVQGYSVVTGTIRGELPEGRYMRDISNIQSIPGS